MEIEPYKPDDDMKTFSIVEPKTKLFAQHAHNWCATWVMAFSIGLLFIHLDRAIAIARMPSPQSDFQIAFDFAQFRGDSATTAVEVYYAYADTLPTFIKQGTGYSSTLKFRFTFTPITGLSESKEWLASYSLQSPPTQFTQYFMSQKSFFLAPGQYVVSVSVIDMNDTSRSDYDTYPFTVRRISQSNLDLSDLELCAFIEPGSTQDGRWHKSHLKNGMYVVPNPEKLIASTSPELKLYSELYNAKRVTTDTVRLEYTLFGGTKREIVRFRESILPVADGLVHTTSFALTDLPSGVYFVKLTAFATIGDRTDSTSAMKKFFLLNPEAAPDSGSIYTEDQLFEMSEFATISSDEALNLEWSMSILLASDIERTTWEALNSPAAKRRFLFKFWLERDLDASTNVNERRDNFLTDVKYSNIYFKTPFVSAGWKSDRGRIRLIYGEPGFVERQIVNELRPYETWYYPNVRGGAEFVFVDLRQINNHICVHSNVPGEKQDSNWQARYLGNSSDPDIDPGRSGPAKGR